MLCPTTELHVKILTKRDTREDATLKKHISSQECTDFAQIGFTLQELLVHCNYRSGVPFRL